MRRDLPLKLVSIVSITAWPAMESLIKLSGSVRAAERRDGESKLYL
jgi:hypothetical protein